jgi:hypothetical protein
MPGITLEIAQAHLATWLEAETKIALGQSFAHAGRALSRADLGTVRAEIQFWNRQVSRLSQVNSGAPRVQRMIVDG